VKALIAWIQQKREKYSHGLDRRTTIILIGSAVLLTLYRIYSRRSFFEENFGRYVIDRPLRELFSYHYWFWSSAITLLLSPLLVIKIGVKDSVRDYGFRLTHGKLGWGFVFGAWALMLPLMVLALWLFPDFQQKYPLCKIAATSWKTLVPYEIAYGVYLFSWEFFYRGFMLFGLERRLGNASILIQTIPFAIMHSSKPLPEAMGSVVAGIALGVVALETRSFIYGAAVHWFVAMTMDVLAIGRQWQM
jgi:hypothetical protein